MQNSILELIKKKKIKELITVIKNDKDINLNVKDINYNYFIYYVIIYNEEELLDLILTRNIRLDILDSDGRNILYYPIKFKYYDHDYQSCRLIPIKKNCKWCIHGADGFCMADGLRAAAWWMIF